MRICSLPGAGREAKYSFPSCFTVRLEMRILICVFPSKVAAFISVVKTYVKVNVDVSFRLFWGPPGPLRMVIYISNCDVHLRRKNTYRTRPVISDRKTQEKMRRGCSFCPLWSFRACEIVLTVVRFGRLLASPVRMRICISNSMLQFNREKPIQK